MTKISAGFDQTYIQYIFSTKHQLSPMIDYFDELFDFSLVNTDDNTTKISIIMCIVITKLFIPYKGPTIQRVMHVFVTMANNTTDQVLVITEHKMPFFPLAVTCARIGTEQWLCVRRTQKNMHMLFFPRGESKAVAKFYVRTYKFT